MSCYHRHGYGCDGPILPPDWYDAYGYRPRRYRDEVVVLRDDDYDDEDRPRRRRGSGRRRYRGENTSAEEVTAASLQERATSLREELVRIEEDLAVLSEEAGPQPVD